jgi:probable HAF family extracellular repeat protein
LIFGFCITLTMATMSFAGPPRYTITDLGTLGGTYSRAAGLNDLGQVTGWSHTSGSSTDRAFLWSAELGMANLGTLGGSRSLAYTINNAGQIVGQSHSGTGFWRAFLWESSTGMVNLGTPSGTIDSVARGINDSGRIAGFAYNSSGNPSAITRDGSGWQTLETLGGTYSQAQAVNAAGRIVGDATLPGNALKSAVIWDEGQVTDLGRLPSTSGATSLDVNAADEVVGWSGDTYSLDGHAFHWSNNYMTDLGTLGGVTSRAYAINDAGLITGASKISTGTQWHGFLYYDWVMYDLNDLVAPGSGWELIDAQDINASGQIVGNGLINGETHAFLLTPVPEPGSLTLILLGGWAMIRRRNGSD